MSKMTKTEAALEAAQRGKATLLKRMHGEKEEGIRTASLGVTAAVIGNLEGTGRINDIPAIGPLPRTATLAIVAKLGAMFLPNGTAKNIANGVGDSATVIATYNFTRGAQISGYQNRGQLTREREAAEDMERQLERRHGRRPVTEEDELAGELARDD